MPASFLVELGADLRDPARLMASTKSNPRHNRYRWLCKLLITFNSNQQDGWMNRNTSKLGKDAKGQLVDG